MPSIKISGITNNNDAKWAAILGVEYVTVSMDERSEKKVSLQKALEIRNMLPSYMSEHSFDEPKIEHNCLTVPVIP